MRIFQKKQFRLFIFVCLLNVLAIHVYAQKTPLSPAQFKHLGGSADEMSAMRLPDPASLGITSKSAVIPLEGDLSQGQTFEIPIDYSQNFRLMLVGPGSKNMNLSAALPAENAFFDLRQNSFTRGVTKTQTTYGFDGKNLPAEVFTFDSAATGILRIRVAGKLKNPENNKKAVGYLVASSDSPVHLRSYIDTFATTVGRKIGFVTALQDDSAKSQTLIGNIRSATIKLQKPNGDAVEFEMRDDGTNEDYYYGDGVFGSSFIPQEAGEYTAQITARGTTPDGAEFIRTSEMVFRVLDARAALGKTASIKQADNLRWQIAVPVSGVKIGQKVLAYAEVWARDAAGNAQPVTWLSGMALAENQSGNRSTTVSLTLDSRWLAISGIGGDYELRNVRLQDPDYFVTLATANKISVPSIPVNAAAFKSSYNSLDEMRTGRRPETFAANNAVTAAVGGKLMLVHGYCSGSNPWNPAQFADSVVFNDLNQNRSHDQFAQLIRDFGAQFPSFGIVAHSQGGAAALHLYTYYWSGLDNATGARLIQSVGTPYQGTSLAGNLAVLGSIFGAGCGSNYDLSYSGAAAWLANIPTWARAKVFYHTTSFTDVWWRYDYCNLASDLVLSDPDDGVIEKAKGQLAGANNMGHKTGWCHTSGMRDPAQTADASRNAIMNANAAR